MLRQPLQLLRRISGLSGEFPSMSDLFYCPMPAEYIH
jgi:hypothetical protein